MVTTMICALGVLITGLVGCTFFFALRQLDEIDEIS